MEDRCILLHVIAKKGASPFADGRKGACEIYSGSQQPGKRGKKAQLRPCARLESVALIGGMRGFGLPSSEDFRGGDSGRYLHCYRICPAVNVMHVLSANDPFRSHRGEPSRYLTVFL